MANIALVVVDDAAPSANDAIIKTTLEGGGHTVTYVADEDSVLGGQDLHFISESGSPTQLGTKYRNLATPVVSLEVGGWDDQLWSDGNGTNIGSGTTWDLQTHDITTGLSDPLTIFDTAAGRYGHATSGIGSQAEVIALHPTTGTDATAFCYDTGSLLNDETTVAAARQVALGLVDSTPDNWTADCKTLVLNAVDWALDAGDITLPLPVSTSTDAAQALSGALAATLPVSTQATTSQALTGALSASLPTVTEFDTGITLTGSAPTVTLPTSTETDTGVVLVGGVDGEFVTTESFNVAQPLTGAVSATLPIALETDNSVAIAVGVTPRDLTILEMAAPATEWGPGAPHSPWVGNRPGKGFARVRRPQSAYQTTEPTT